MKIEFCSTKFEEIKEMVVDNVSNFSSLIDGFLIDHILDSNHYKIMINEVYSGYFSIYKCSLLTQFYIKPSFSSVSQTIFADVKRMENVEKAFVPTSDEFFLSHTLDSYKEIIKQAYFFNAVCTYFSIDNNFMCKLAELKDLDFIKEKTGDFFDKPSEHIEKKELWIAYYDSICVGFGLNVKSPLLNDVIEIGMFVNSEKRQKGYGTMIIQWLINYNNSLNKKTVAGCYYYNHQSKKTLERAGMFSNTRLLKIVF